MTTDHAQTRHRWFQFRLRTLFILVVVLAVPLAWLAHERGKVRARHDWLESITRDRTAFLRLSPGAPAQPEWLRSMLGDDTEADVDGLFFGGSEVTDAGFSHLDGMTGLEVLLLNDTRITNTGLVHFTGLANLKILLLSHTQVTNAGLVHLAGLTKLEYLALNNTQVTDAGLVHLASLTQLRELLLGNTPVTDAGLVHLTGLSHLQILHLQNTQVTDAGWQELKRVLPNLKVYH